MVLLYTKTFISIVDYIGTLAIIINIIFFIVEFFFPLVG